MQGLCMASVSAMITNTSSHAQRIRQVGISVHTMQRARCINGRDNSAIMEPRHIHQPGVL